MKYNIAALTKKDAEYIKEKIAEYDFSAAPARPGTAYEKLVFKITDGDRNIIGGLIFSIDAWNTLELENLWIDERYRGQKLGPALIREAERLARERGCRLSIVATWDYQARPLYEKHGYTLRSTVKDWPKGHESYYLSKRLDDRSREYASSTPQTTAIFEITRGSDADAKFIHQKLHEYNCAEVPRLHAHIPAAIKLAADDGAMIAGCAADVDSLDIAVLESIWVSEERRGEGLGSYLLGEVERQIKEAGGLFVVAYVYDWQLGFFEKNGYSSCGKIEDRPEGHSFYVLKKMM